MKTLDKLLDTLVDQYIKDQFFKNHRRLIPCEAREELLGGGKIYFVASGTMTPINVFQDTELAAPHCNPVILDSYGDLPDVYWKFEIDINVCDNNGIFLAAYTNVCDK